MFVNILFLCTGNACRSIIAEALFRHVAPQGVAVQSAGSEPTGTVHPRALAVLQKAGIPTEGLYSKSWDGLAGIPDVVITLCADAAGEACPLSFGTVVRSHWGMPDPAKATGDEKTIRAAFDSTFAVLKKRVEALARLRFDALKADAQTVQKALDAIAAQ